MNITKATPKERLQLVVVHLVSIVDAVVYLGSFTLLSTELRAKALFSWFE